VAVVRRRYSTPGVRRAVAACTVLAALSGASAGLSDPFPLGSGMGNLGAIVWANGSAGRQPWTPASFYCDTARFGGSISGALYYDRMDNSGSISRFALGAWGRLPQQYLIVKGSYARLNALGVYFEDDACMSVGANAARYVNIGLDLCLWQSGVRADGERPVRMAYVRESLWLPWSFAAFSFTATHLALYRTPGAGLDMPVLLQAGLHSTRHRFGAQGVLITLRYNGEVRFGFRVAEEYWFHPSVSLCAALGTNPTLVSVGLTVARRRWSASGAVVHHPVLGWSEGAGVEMWR